MLNSKFLTNLIVTIVIVLFALYLIKALDISYPVLLTSTTKSTELAVVGEGKIDVIPDVAYIDAGVTVSEGITVSEVQQTINETNNNIIEAMKKLGISKADIKTSNYSISPNYIYENNQNRIGGYNGNATTEIKVRNPQMVSQVVEAVTKAGANQINSTQFVVDNPEKYREDARNKAIQNAKEQAAKVANSLGIKLGKVVNIIESTPTNTGIVYPMRSLSSSGVGGGSAPSIEPGNQTITSTVTLYFEKR
jgi:uncharacterized protein